jgi:hypothetical protein
MRHIVLHLVVAAASLAAAPAKGIEMKIQMKIGTATVVGALVDNPTARDFFSMLPLTVTLEDYAATEKVTYVALYYRDGPDSPGLVPLGRIESGLEALQFKGPRKVLIEKAGK